MSACVVRTLECKENIVHSCTLNKSDSTHHFFGNACTKLGPLQFSNFSGC